MSAELLASFLGGCIAGSLITAVWGFNTLKNNLMLKIEIARLKEIQASEAQKTEWIKQAETRLREAFESLAGQAMRSNADALLSHARSHLESALNQARGDWKTHKAELQHLMDPVRQNLTELDSYIRELEQKREGAYQGVSEQLRQLAKLQSELQSATITLTQALKSSSVRGRWGEIQLRRVVELAGMVKHVSFEEQVSADTGRPDMIIHLPNAGILPIDAKAPLESYLEAVETPDEERRKLKLASHAKALKSRIRELGQKKYWEQFPAVPDFVVMFVPSDACLSAAFEFDSELLEYAIAQQVLPTTPVTLIALLKAVAYGWQQQQLTENARHIAAQGQELYKRLKSFLDNLSELGRQFTKSIETYNKMTNALKSHLMPVARRLSELNSEASEIKSPEPMEIQAKPPLSENQNL